MPSFVMHKDGAFNMFSTVSDCFYFEPALTERQFARWYQREYGQHGMEDLPKRMERAKKTGCSALDISGYSFDTCLLACRGRDVRGGQEAHTLTRATSIRRFLTLPGKAAKAKEPAS